MPGALGLVGLCLAAVQAGALNAVAGSRLALGGTPLRSRRARDHRRPAGRLPVPALRGDLRRLLRRDNQVLMIGHALRWMQQYLK